MTGLLQFARNIRAAAVMEFAIVAPVLVLLLFGGMDLAHTAYTQSMLEGAMQKAGRDSGIEGATIGSIDDQVKEAVRIVAPNAAFVVTRKAYTSFTNVRPERFTDTNKNGVHDANECFEDVNNNKRWDADPGAAGQGGAGDVTLYTVEASYPRLFPLATMIGWPASQTIKAQTLLKNQPYATQAVPTVTPCA